MRPQCVVVSSTASRRVRALPRAAAPRPEGHSCRPRCRWARPRRRSAGCDRCSGPCRRPCHSSCWRQRHQSCTQSRSPGRGRACARVATVGHSPDAPWLPVALALRHPRLQYQCGESWFVCRRVCRRSTLVRRGLFRRSETSPGARFGWQS